MSKRTCQEKHFRHRWFRNRHGRQECERCGKLNPVGVPPYLRFWDYVHKTDPCWFWMGCIHKPSGYAHFNPSMGEHNRRLRAHRYAWVLYYGYLPEPHLDLHHTCNNRSCVNVKHLKPVTRKENVRAKPDYGICKRGHKIEGSNEYKPPSGSRRCRKCLQAYRKKTSRKSC